jgi:hypothetical protein
MKTFDVKYLDEIAIGLDAEEVRSRFAVYIEQAGEGTEFRAVCREYQKKQ